MAYSPDITLDCALFSELKLPSYPSPVYIYSLTCSTHSSSSSSSCNSVSGIYIIIVDVKTGRINNQV